MSLFLAAAVGATFLCALVTGFLFAFAVVTMPGLRTLDDGEFIRAFQVIDRVIQNNQPLFVLVWIGSAVLLLVAVIAGLGRVTGIDRLLLIASAAVYLLGVQLPTMTVNVPLNNRLQALDVAGMTDDERKKARSDFEPPWSRWNAVRTVLSSLTTALLITLLVRL